MNDIKAEYYLELEQKIHTLRTHYEMCKGADNKEVLDWSKFFLAWSKVAAVHCGPWAKENLKTTENFAKNLEGSKVGVMGYEVLENIMGEASVGLNCEILESLRKVKKPQELSRAGI